jgi:hypothetical protein
MQQHQQGTTHRELLQASDIVWYAREAVAVED